MAIAHLSLNQMREVDPSLFCGSVSYLEEHALPDLWQLENDQTSLLESSLDFPDLLGYLEDI